MSSFFDYLDERGLKYCVVGRTEELPQKISGDIDLVIEAGCLNLVYRYILDFSRMHPPKMVNVLKHEQSAYYFVMVWKDGAGKLRFFHPDICDDYFRSGRKFLSANEILSFRTLAVDKTGKRKNFYVAAPAKEFIYYLLKKVGKQTLDDEHGEHLSAVWAKASEECNAEINRFWSRDHANLLRRAAGTGDWQEVRQKLPSLKKSLHAKLPLNSLKLWRRECARILKRVLFPTGLHVAFLGSDGSGKSSVIDRVVPDLAPAFRKTARFHLRPGLGMKKDDGKLVPDPHCQAPWNLPVSIVKTFYLWFDYFIGWWVVVWPKIVCSTLVVFDRYYHDLLVDPKRYRYGGPMWLARWTGKLIPKPDLWVLLDAPPEILQTRKQEVPFEETVRQRGEYLKLVQDMKNGVIIDASQNLDDVVADVNSAIIDFMTQRTQKRHGR